MKRWIISFGMILLILNMTACATVSDDENVDKPPSPEVYEEAVSVKVGALRRAYDRYYDLLVYNVITSKEWQEAFSEAVSDLEKCALEVQNLRPAKGYDIVQDNLNKASEGILFITENVVDAAFNYNQGMLIEISSVKEDVDMYLLDADNALKTKQGNDPELQ
ncbi:hypothetical protein BMT55_16610 [Listeria newyorkensis]|uniref:Lipoprotein n=1 Tax=Listeria newyorkensis TaxID=1497681 RepID=A0ABX4XJT3_9LIST|nr:MULTISPECIES: hypothetical protein [Listeria]KGL39578.1 hypothetical protein EP56_13525 [Listeriaceae bacterium FSL A5-0209]KGL44150.1 hypothetical protein EP58_06800 [Listeria newyorkensis]PNP87054.1 hypothetical protein BMT55_16610 [Listeria newyorkensis]RQW67124.1 hypothetical protein DUK53_08000 [Listeria sp. SHR_NRA_18]WAO21744.1 hypothetical protein OTR81_00080 [Listeria newyorkensis]